MLRLAGHVASSNWDAFAFIAFVLIAWLVHRVFLSNRDINYYVSERPFAFWLAAGCGSILSLATVIMGIFF